MFKYKNIILIAWYLYLSLHLEHVNGLGISGATKVSQTGGGSKCMLFFTGGSNLFQSSIYNEFIEEMESRDVDVYDIPFQYQITQADIDELNSKYKYDYQNINVIGHSSGCTTLLNQCSNLNGIKNIFLMDPVNTNFSKNKWWINKKFNSLSFIHATKSYKITFDPFGLPFIPIFKLTTENLNIDDDVHVWKLDVKNYGHSDILNEPLSDFMHKTRLSVGNKNRGQKTRKKYFDIILSFIKKIID